MAGSKPVTMSTQDHGVQERQQVTCTICLGPYTEPKVLQCSHVFCQHCLQSLVKRRTITCPLCQQDTNLLASDGGLEELKPASHQHNQNLIESSLQRTLSKGSQLDGEKSLTISPTAPCHHHRTEKTSLFCETCQKLICQQCTIDTHNGHKYDLISEAYKKGKKYLKSMLTPAERELEISAGVMDEYCERRDEILAQKAKIEGEINDVMCQLEEALAAKKAELHSQLEMFSHVKLTALNVDKGKLHSMQTSLRSDLAHVRNITNHATEEELLLAKKSCHQMLKGSCDNAERSKLQPRERANMILKTNLELVLQSLQTFATVTTYQECPRKCFASGKGLSQASVGKRSKAIVHVVDHDDKLCKEACANEIKYEIVPYICGGEGEKLTGCAKKRIDGHYELSYTPAIKGMHELTIAMYKQHIKGSPFKVAVKSKDGPENLITTLPCAHKPCGVALTQNDQLLAISTHSTSITVMRQSGEKVEEFGVGKFADAAVGDDGTVYATILDKNEIQKFSVLSEDMAGGC